jgi:hypothetical protein
MKTAAVAVATASRITNARIRPMTVYHRTDDRAVSHRSDRAAYRPAVTDGIV